MTIPEKIELTCTHCGHSWSVPLADLKAQPVTIYRDGEPTVRRRVPCPNCHKSVITDVPQAWLNDE